MAAHKFTEIRKFAAVGQRQDFRSKGHADALFPAVEIRKAVSQRLGLPVLRHMKRRENLRLSTLGQKDGIRKQHLPRGIGMDAVRGQGVSGILLLDVFRQGGHGRVQIQIMDFPESGLCLQLLHIFQNPAFKSPLFIPVFGKVYGTVLVAHRRGEKQDIAALQAVLFQPPDQRVHARYVILGGNSQNGFIGAKHDHRLVKSLKGGILVINIQHITDFVTACADVPEFCLPVREKAQVIQAEDIHIGQGCVGGVGDAVSDKAHTFPVTVKVQRRRGKGCRPGRHSRSQGENA